MVNGIVNTYWLTGRAIGLTVVNFPSNIYTEFTRSPKKADNRFIHRSYIVYTSTKKESASESHVLALYNGLESPTHACQIINDCIKAFKALTPPPSRY